MLLARAFILQASPRAILAVLAVAVSVAYGILAIGAAGLLAASPAALEAEGSERGTLLVAPGGGPIPLGGLPDDAVVLTEGRFGGARLVTLEPWPFDENLSYAGSYAEGPRPELPNGTNLSWAPGIEPMLAADAYNLPPHVFATYAPASQKPVAAYVPRPDVQVEALDSAPWEGAAAFYETGALELSAGLRLLVVATGLIGGMIVGSFVRLEILAREGELRTVAAISGRSVVKRIIWARALVLAGAGTLVGVVGALVAARVIDSALDGVRFQVPVSAMLLASATTLVAGVLLGFSAATSAIAGEGGTGRRLKVRRFPGPIRFLVVSPRVFPGVFAATVVAVTVLASFAGGLSVPTQLFSAESDEQVIVGGSGNPLYGTADRFLGEHGAALAAVNATLPITFAPTVLDGGPVLVKGTNVSRWHVWVGAEVEEGRLPAARGEATVGYRAARVHGLGPGDQVILPASYRADHTVIDIVGIHRTGGLDDDELITDLDTAGRLADYPLDKVSMIHVRMEDPMVDARGLRLEPGIQVLDVRFEPEDPVPLSPAVVVIALVNHGDTAAERHLVVRINGNVTKSALAAMGPGERRDLRLEVLVPDTESLVLTVNPAREGRTAVPGLVLDAPERVAPDERFTVSVRDRNGTATRALLLVDGAVDSGTDDAGRADLDIASPGIYTLTAKAGDLTGGVRLFVTPPAWGTEAHVVVRELHVAAQEPLNETHYRIRLLALVDNPSHADFSGSLTSSVDDTPTGHVEVDVEEASRTTVAFTETVPLGEHRIGLADAHLVVDRLDPPPSVDDDLPSGGDAPQGDDGAAVDGFDAAVGQIRQQRQEASTAPDDPSQAFISDVFTRLDVAGSLVVLVTFVHTGALVWVSLHREVRERESVQRLLRGVGMDTAIRRRRAVRDAFLACLPGVAAGVGVAFAALTLGGSHGLPAAFGHALPTTEVDIHLRTGLVILMLGIGAALHATAGLREPTRIQSPRKTPSEWFDEGGPS